MSAINLSPGRRLISGIQGPREFTDTSVVHEAASGYRKKEERRVKDVSVVFKDLCIDGELDPNTFLAMACTTKEGIPIDRSLLTINIDFSHPDGTRARPITVESRRLFVCDQYMSMWSPVLRAFISEAPVGAEITLPNIKFRHMREVLECISPMHKEVNEKNCTAVLPIAFEYQMEGLLYRCEEYLLNSRLVFLERIWLADRYRLERLLCRCIGEIIPTEKMDLNGKDSP